jgi:hypothetical protein
MLSVYFTLRRRLLLVSVIILLWAAGCGGEAAPAAVSQATPFPTMTPRPTATRQPTYAPPTEPPPGQPTSVPTSTPLPTPTQTPGPTPTYAPHAPDVEQPPYAESACSDRFPCNDDVAAWEARIQVPPGFRAEYFAFIPAPEGAPRAQELTAITVGPDGLLYVATRRGAIYQVDANGQLTLYAEGFTVPTGMAFQPGTQRLYVSNRVRDANVDGEAQISIVENGQISSLFAGLPCCYIGMHGPNGIVFGPDGYGYVGVGGRADHGEILDGSNRPDTLHPWEAAILRFSPDGQAIEVYARGFRNPYDIAWDSQGRLWASDNGRDGSPGLGDAPPPDELKLVTPGGEHGYPYYECPNCFGIPEGIDLLEPFYLFEAHTVPTGTVAYQAMQFPGYHDSILVTLWTALPFASRVMRITPDGQASTFATGFAAPIDLEVDAAGNLYVADYATGIIFKISYTQ